MVIIFVTLVLLIVLTVLIVRHNLHRYALLHFDMTDGSYIGNYMTLNRVNYDHKVIVSLTTTPKRIKKIKPMIKSILNQTVRIDQIALNIPKKCRGQSYEVPPELEHMVNVYTCGRDYGDGTKCIPTLLRENDSETLLILLQDNYIYGEDFIETIIEEYKQHPECCLYAKGVIVVKCGCVKEDIVDITRDQVTDKLLMKYVNAPKRKIEIEGMTPLKMYY